MEVDFLARGEQRTTEREKSQSAARLTRGVLLHEWCRHFGISSEKIGKRREPTDRTVRLPVWESQSGLRDRLSPRT